MSNERNILPNLIIGGSPKCGTSSLFYWLKDHPEICASDIKETGFLLDKVWSFNEVNYITHGLEGYSRLFPSYKGEKIVMEATTTIPTKAAGNFLVTLGSRNMMAIVRPTSPSMIKRSCPCIH